MQEFFFPANTPDEIVLKIFNVFAKRHSSLEMHFDDFLELYYLLENEDDQHLLIEKWRLRAQLYFHVFLNKFQDGTTAESFNAC